MKHSPLPPASDTTSRRGALQTLSRVGLAGSAALSAGWSWPLKAATADAPPVPANHPSGTSRPELLPRLVTVGGGITEVVYALGAQSQLVGTDTTSLYPTAAQSTAKVGYMRQLSAEGLLALRPNALIAGTDAGPPVVMDQIRSAGVQVELIESDHTWEEVQRKIKAVGKLARRETRAELLRQHLDTQWRSTLAKTKATQSSPVPKVLFILSHTGSPLVSGEGTAAHAVIGLMGAHNAMTGFKGYRPMTAEAMAAAAPDLILTTTQGLDALGGRAQFWQRPEIALTPAYQRRHLPQSLIAMDALEMLGFGPRLPHVIQTLHQQWARPS